MTEFTFEGPSRVVHRDGWRIRNIARHLVSYEEPDGRRAEIEIERGFSSDTLYPDTLRWVFPDERGASVTEREQVIPRVVSALVAISGDPVELSVGGT